MTLIVGIVCKDGVVVASDSAAMFGKEGIPTIGQQRVTKVLRLTESVIFSSTGAIGMAQVIGQKVKDCWEKSEFSGLKTPAEVMDKIGKHTAELVAPYLQTANFVRPLVGDASPSLCKTLVAMPVKHVPACLPSTITVPLNNLAESYLLSHWGQVSQSQIPSSPFLSDCFGRTLNPS